MKNYLRYLIRKYRFRKIRSRVLAALIALSLPPIFLIGVIAFNISSNSLVDTHIQAHEQQLETFNQGIELIFGNIIKMNRFILSSEDIREQLIERDKNRLEDQKTTGQLQQIMFEYLIENQHVDSLCLMDNQFRIVCYGRSDNAGIYRGEDKVADIVNSEWYGQAIEAKGREVFLNYNLFQPEDKSTFSSVKRLLDPEEMSLNPMGFLIVNMNKSMFTDVLNNSNDSTGLLIINPDSKNLSPVYSSNDYLNQLPESNDLSQVYEQLEEDDYVYSQFTNQDTGWHFIHTIPEDVLLKEPHQIRSLTLFIAVLIAISAIGLSVYISGTITRPLRKIKGMILLWAKGQRDFTETSYRDDEIGEIGDTFKWMVKENKDLGEKLTRSKLKERETELRVLQAQINPHFLYNTLDSIYWMAILNDQDEIAKMSISLSESFKILLSEGKETIPIREELKHIEHYMNIQKFRFGDKITYYSSVEPHLNDKPILKLLLQPLVENAIYHGLEKKHGDGFVTLTGKEEGGFIVFLIEDNGVGMEEVDVIQEGYGIGNIKERLDLYYGDSSSFKVESYPNYGTTIEIRFDPSKGGSDHE